MSWRKEGQDLVYDGVEMGIAPSPTKGTANLQNVNIATETGEAMASFARFKENQDAIVNGTLTASVSDGAYLLDAPASLKAGQWITVSASTIPSVTSAADFLLVGGGGGGGGASTSEASGGGGGGGMVESTFTPSVGAYSVVVGEGGSGGAIGVVGENGGFSSISNGNVSFDYLIVGGGGGGGGVAAAMDKAAGGGGAGQLQTGTTSQSAGIFSIVVGAGGAGGIGDNAGASGSSSSIFGLTSVGGGGGGRDGVNGVSGASGGGGGQGTTTGGTATAGFAGGDGNADGGGGGGGASAVGGTGTIANAGGAGTASSITGSSVTYAGGGGGGGALAGGGGAGGSGGGGGGEVNNDGNPGTANTGGGGGGAGNFNTSSARTGGAGGSGVVIIRFTTSAISYTQTGGAVATDGSSTVITWNTTGTFSFGTVGLARGGGGGGSDATAGQDGGSGGGGGSESGTSAGSGLSGQGNNGGSGDDGGGTDEAGGGGGGAGAVGGNATTDGGDGGNGAASSISGASVTYAGGGGGGARNGFPGSGGTGGGGVADLSAGTGGLGGGGGGTTGGASEGRTGYGGGSGIVIISYTTGTMTATGGAITYAGGNTIHTFTTSGTFTVSSIATSGQYFVSYKDSNNKVKLSAIFDPYGLYPIVHGTTGTATFSTLAVTAAGVAKATERYNSADQNYFRYYILDSNSRTWVYDSQVYAYTLANNGVGEAWMLPDPTDYSAEDFTGMAILNGWLVQVNNTNLWGKPTSDLGRAFDELTLNGTEMRLVTPFPTHKNPAYVGVQGKLYYGDRNYLGELFPVSSIASGLANVQSFSSFTGSGTTGTLTSVISGSSPFLQNSAGAIARVPVVFFSTQTTGVPAAITEGVVYWVAMSQSVDREFQVYETTSGGTALNISTIGTSYFNTFYPLGDQDDVTGTYTPIFQFSQQRLNLPTYEEIQCMVEVGNLIVIGCRSNNLYPWNQVDALPTVPVSLPESDSVAMVNANNMAYVLAGNKGNVYITNGSSASVVLKVPDYCAGVPGTPLTYIEPKFTWGDIDFVRGRIYISILDQTSTKAGNCGGVWSFVPTQNFYYGQDTGTSLRLENQNSYGNYSGMATIILPSQEQDAIGPQYWTSWMNSYSISSSTSFGIDQTDDIPVTTFVVESDLIPVGTFFSKTTFQNFEFKMTTPLQSGDSVALYWRKNSTDAWTALTEQELESSTPLSGNYKTNAENCEWLQIRGVFTTNGTTGSSFDRFKEIRVR